MRDQGRYSRHILDEMYSAPSCDDDRLEQISEDSNDYILGCYIERKRKEFMEEWFLYMMRDFD